jgi:hypothetical protein
MEAHLKYKYLASEPGENQSHHLELGKNEGYCSLVWGAGEKSPDPDLGGNCLGFLAFWL